MVVFRDKVDRISELATVIVTDTFEFVLKRLVIVFGAVPLLLFLDVHLRPVSVIDLTVVQV